MKVLTKVLNSCSLICILATIFAFLGSANYFFELFEHFRIQYFISLLIAAPIYLALKHKKHASICLFFGFSNIPFLYGMFISNDPIKSNLKLKVAQMNIYSPNKNYSLAEKFILREDPDIVVLQEITPKWIKELDSIIKRYPYSLLNPRSDNFGIVLLSKYDLKNIETKLIGDVPMYLGIIEVNNSPIFLMAAHPVPPAGKRRADIRNSQLESYKILLNNSKAERKLLIGDLNITPFCHRYSDLLESTKLFDSASGFGPQFTWPDGGLFPLGIKLDYILHNKAFQTVSFRVGESIGSDHKPIISELIFK